ncbi:MAG: hypothetical protein LBH82_02600 [Bacteroidales bacterium]|jgi:hypothetical protein|nr:hypothetical protein [Bacteroidales bacterium]
MRTIKIKDKNMKWENSAQLFVNSFLYVFGLTKNPIHHILENQQKISDADKIRGDWEKVGNDILNAYEQEITTRK